MYELTGNIINGDSVSFDAYGCPIVHIRLDKWQSALKMVDELKNEQSLTIKLDKHKPKRSLDANAYCWVLIGKIAEKTNVPKNEVYQNAIKVIGGNYEIVCVQNKALESLCQMWQRNGIGWMTDTMPSKLEGCTNVFLYYGSSVFNVEQMSRLISNIQEDCRSLGIEVKPKEEIDSLLREWGK